MTIKFILTAALFGCLTVLTISWLDLEPETAAIAATQIATSGDEALTRDESNNITVFKDVSPAVVFVTTDMSRTHTNT